MNAEIKEFCMLRRPMFPLEMLYDFHQKLSEDPNSFEKQLLLLFENSQISASILTASPRLYDGLASIGTAKTKEKEKIFKAFYKYLVRMCSRPTPFGLFSGFLTGTLAEKTSIIFQEKESFYPYQRLDPAATRQFAQVLLSNKRVLAQTVFFANPSIYQAGTCVRYIEKKHNDGQVTNLLTALEIDPFTESIIKYAQNGATIKQLIALAPEQVSKHHARALVAYLIDIQILVDEFEINVTGKPYLQVMKERLNQMKIPQKQLNALGKFSLADQDISRLPAIYQNYQASIKENSLEKSPDSFIQIDTRFNAASCQINKHRIKQLQNEFKKISPILGSQKINSDLEDFKIKFLQRYQDNAVPLVEVLDCESGIGYGLHIEADGKLTTLLEKLDFIEHGGHTEPVEDEFEELRLELLLRCETQNLQSIVLTENDLKKYVKRSSAIPYSYWLGSIITDSQDHFDKGEFTFLLKSVGGQSGFELMARFAHADPKLEEDLKRMAASVQADHPDIIFAQIAHLASPQMANIVCRPHLREYEIVDMAASTMPKENRIYPNELMVSIPDGKQIVLTSKRLGKRIIPCVDTAHNFKNGLPLYKFLCDLAMQGAEHLSRWDWGKLSTRPFLPRIQYKHLILCRASWYVDTNRFPFLLEKNTDFTSVWKKLSHMLAIPRYFQICESDREFLIDAHCGFSLSILKDFIQKNKKVYLVEIFEQPSKGLLSYLGRSFANEIVLPFKSCHLSNSFKIVQTTPISKSNLQSTFLPGDQWLYIKIYAGPMLSDQLLAGIINDFSEALIRSNQVQKWFFIRYKDSAPHIRLRYFNEDNPDFWQKILTDLNTHLRPMLLSGQITAIQTDTYHRETQRYAELSYDTVESIFYQDSIAVAEIIKQQPQQQTHNEERWLCALLGADYLLNDLGFDLPAKLRITKMLHQQFLDEFSSAHRLIITLNDQYRHQKTAIKMWIENPPENIKHILERRSEQIKNALTQSLAINETVSDHIAASLIHMFFNRIFISQPRKHEMVMYHYLSKYYETLIILSQNTQK